MEYNRKRVLTGKQRKLAYFLNFLSNSKIYRLGQIEGICGQQIKVSYIDDGFL